MMQTDGFSINIHHPWSSLSVISKLMFVKKNSSSIEKYCIMRYVCIFMYAFTHR